MIKRLYTRLSLILMLAAAAPALSPALPVKAAARVAAEGTASVSADLSAGKFTTENGRTYCKNADGSNRTGWVSEAGSWYYFDKKDGHMRTGWVKDGDKWYYLNTKDGKMVTGWLVLNTSGTKYYLKKDGSMIQGPAWAVIGSGKYFFTSDGDVVNAWELKNGKWYYYTTEGTAVTNRWILYKNRYYYMTSDGSAAAGTVKVEGKEYKFGKSCELLGAVPSSVAAAAKAPLTGAKLKSGTENVKTVKDSAASAKKTDDASQKEAAAKEEASKAAASAAITKVAGKLNETTESRKQFVIQIANYVRKYAPQYGIKVYSPIIAQAIHESGWGESSLSAKYHNYFGLKCGTLWKGKSVNLSTKEEYSAGTLTTIRSNFRAYDSMEEGVKGYFEFIQLKRYANLKGVTNPRQYLQNIKNDGYCTGSQYVDHTMAIINLYNLTQFDK